MIKSKRSWGKPGEGCATQLLVQSCRPEAMLQAARWINDLNGSKTEMQIGPVWYINTQSHAWNDTHKQSWVLGDTKVMLMHARAHKYRSAYYTPMHRVNLMIIYKRWILTRTGDWEKNSLPQTLARVKEQMYHLNIWDMGWKNTGHNRKTEVYVKPNLQRKKHPCKCITTGSTEFI